MKTKKIKRFVCLLLAFVVLLAMPLNTQAHAVALESWVMYAIITGLAAMGITFIVAGGVEAMTNAIQEKVDEYIAVGLHPQFIQLLLNGIKLVPSPSGGTDPDGNQLRNLFFNALAWDALEKFVDWLTSDGGWSGNVNSSLSSSTFSCQINGVDTVAVTSDIGNSFSASNLYSINNLGTVFEFDYSTNFYIDSSTNFNSVLGTTNYFSSTEYNDTLWYYYGTGTDWYSRDNLQSYISNYGYTEKWRDVIVGITFAVSNNSVNDVFVSGLLTTDNKFIPLWSPTINSSSVIANKQVPSDLITLASTVDIITPEELEKQFPEVNQGVIMQQLEIGSPEIQEWARQVEELFIETGTIPQPQPQVITDPATEPVPTPAPTTPPIQDVDDLGLPTLGEAVFNKFPFSLPRDLKRIAEILNAEPVTPYWEVDLFAPLADDISFAGDTTLRIDLSEYEALGQISRWASVIGFCIMLIIITKGVIKW